MSEYEKRQVERARESYAKHTELKTMPGGSAWHISRAGDSGLAVKIIVDRPHLIVCGAPGFEPAIFRGKESGRPDASAMVRWVAGANLGYMAEKLYEGMGEGRAYSYDYDETIRDLKRLKTEALEEWDEDAGEEPDLAVWDEAEKMAYRHDSGRGARYYISSKLSDGWEIASGIGQVYSDRLVYAREACRALVRLLDAEEMRDQPDG